MRSAIRHFSLWLTVLLLVAPQGRSSESATASAQAYRLSFYHTHTRERLDIVYRRGDTYAPEALDELDHFLRDHRTGEVRHFDPHLFDLLHDLTVSLNDSGGEIDVICGYRTPSSNEFLRTRSPHTGVLQVTTQANAIAGIVLMMVRSSLRELQVSPSTVSIFSRSSIWCRPRFSHAEAARITKKIDAFMRLIRAI